MSAERVASGDATGALGDGSFGGIYRLIEGRIARAQHLGRVGDHGVDENRQIITVATRDTTCDGPEDIWRWERKGDPVSPKLLARGVTDVSIREVALQPFELPTDITGRAPG